MAIAKSLTLLMKLKTDDFQQGLKGAERSAGRAADSITKSGKRAEKSWRDVGTAVTSLKGLFAGFVTAAFFKQIADVSREMKRLYPHSARLLITLNRPGLFLPLLIIFHENCRSLLMRSGSLFLLLANPESCRQRI